jgi:hypothetical protein
MISIALNVLVGLGLVLLLSLLVGMLDSKFERKDRQIQRDVRDADYARCRSDAHARREVIARSRREN